MAGIFDLPPKLILMIANELILLDLPSACRSRAECRTLNGITHTSIKKQPKDTFENREDRRRSVEVMGGFFLVLRSKNLTNNRSDLLRKIKQVVDHLLEVGRLQDKSEHEQTRK
jgi:hypothetical protein